jgi:hypothetical protein
VTKAGGAGTFANWTIYTSNQPGSDGATGATGLTGATGRMAGLPYTYEASSFTAADPTSGKFKTNNASFAATTAIYISETDGDGNAVTKLLQYAAQSTSAVRGQLTFFKIGAVNNWVSFDVNGSFTDNGGWDTIVVTYRDGSGTIGDEDAVLLHVDRVGDKGDTGTTGAPGDTGAQGETGPTATHELDWDTGTTDADPGNGRIRGNHATYSSITELYVDNLERAGGSITAWLDSWDDSSHTARRGDIIIRQVADVENWLHLFVDGVVTDATGYRRVPVDYVGHNGTLTGRVSVLFLRTGDDGEDGEGAGNVNTSGSVTAGDLAVYADGTGNVIQSGGAKTAASIPNVPAGTIAATNVQAALNELDTDKAPTANPSFTGTVEVSQALTMTGDISPSQITSDQNNYAPTGFSTASVLRLDSDAARNITGLAGGADGRVVVVVNVGSFAITLKDESGSSTAANRFALAADLVLATDQAAILYYDATTASWHALKSGLAASEISFTPTGDIAAATVQLALAELDTDKLAKAGGTMTGALTLAGDPASSLHAATKQYVDGLAANLGKRARVRVATTANITIASDLNNGDALDGVTLGSGDLVLVKDQSSAAQNGIYVVGAVPARATEFDSYDEHPGSLIAVAEGTANADTIWLCTSNAGGTLDSTSIAFSKLVVTGELLAANNLSDVANAATAFANIKQAASEAATGVVELATIAEAGTGTDTSRAVTPAGLFPAYADVASAATTDLGAVTSDKVRITGTTRITSFGTIAAGILKHIRFAGALTLTHNATSLILPGGANIATAADDRAIAVSLGSGNWIVVAYIRASGLPVVIATTAQYLANTAARALTTDQVNAAGALFALTDGAAINWDMASGFNASVTLAGNRTLANAKHRLD